MARDRDQQHDLSNTLTMLHATLVQTGSNLQDALSRGLEKVETGNQTAQRGTTDMVVAELSRMRTDLRDTKNRLAANREELSEEVRTALTLLRQEIHKVKDAVGNAPATEAEPPRAVRCLPPAARPRRSLLTPTAPRVRPRQPFSRRPR